MIKNNKGVTLTELLAYIAIIGVVVTLLTGTLTFAIRTHDQINGQGALDSEASVIMSTLMNLVNNFDAEFVQTCEDEDNKVCLDLVNEKEWIINEYGLMEEVIIDKHLVLKITEGKIYVNNMQLNNDDYYVEGTINPDESDHFIIKIRLAIYRINKNGDKISKTTVYESHITY